MRWRTFTAPPISGGCQRFGSETRLTLLQLGDRDALSQSTQGAFARHVPRTATMAVPIPARTVSKPMDTSDDDAPASPGSRAPLRLQLAVSFAQGWVLPPFYGTIMGGATIALLSATGCAVTRDQSSVGEFIDDTAITTGSVPMIIVGKGAPAIWIAAARNP